LGIGDWAVSAGGSFRDNYLRFARVKCSRGEIRNIFELPESMQAKRKKKRRKEMEKRVEMAKE